MAKRPKVEENPVTEETNAVVEETTEKKTKSIVPARYAGRYKGGGSDALAEFIKAQCQTKDGFDFPAFFDLCRKNGLPEDKVAMYEGQVAEKRHGAQGRARMTLRNMLATIVRKDGKITGINGEVVELSLPKPALSGAAAKAKADAGEAVTSQL
jgi:hypothetical protein